MRKFFIDELFSRNLISEEQHRNIISWLATRPFSLHWELRALLYAGILLLTTGLGIIVYKNIDTIGHTAIISIIAGGCAGCFYYCFKHKLPWSNERSQHPSPVFDYILLLGCLLFITLEGYLQFQYNIFGTRYGIATLIPAVLFLTFAYLFDHLGVLSLGITSLASFVGLTVSPGILFSNSLIALPLIYSSIVFSLFLVVAGYYFNRINLKKHFTFTYYNWGINLFFITVLSGIFNLEMPYLYFALLLVGCVILFRYSLNVQSYYFLLLFVIYGYIGLTWLAFQIELSQTLRLFYFVFSCIGIIWFFLNVKKLVKQKK